MRLKDIPRIRTRQDDDGQPIAVAVRKRFRPDHLFEDQGRDGLLENRFGVFWVRDTTAKAKYAESKYRTTLSELGAKVVGEQIGDFDGILHFEATDPEQIPEWFRKPAGKVAAGRVRAQALHRKDP